MALRGLLEKSSDADLLREMIGFAAQRLMKLENEGLCGAAHGEHSAARPNQRNRYRERDGKPGPGPSSWAFPSSGRAPTSRPFWSLGEPPRRRWRR
jgi:transposase-like protein